MVPSWYVLGVPSVVIAVIFAITKMVDFFADRERQALTNLREENADLRRRLGDCEPDKRALEAENDRFRDREYRLLQTIEELRRQK